MKRESDFGRIVTARGAKTVNLYHKELQGTSHSEWGVTVKGVYAHKKGDSAVFCGKVLDITTST